MLQWIIAAMEDNCRPVYVKKTDSDCVNQKPSKVNSEIMLMMSLFKDCSNILCLRAGSCHGRWSLGAFGLCCDWCCSCLQGQSHWIPPAQQRSSGRVFLTDWQPLHGSSPLGYERIKAFCTITYWLCHHVDDHAHAKIIRLSKEDES